MGSAVFLVFKMETCLVPSVRKSRMFWLFVLYDDAKSC